jgi:sugar lactone lactonase YvrE
MKRSTVLMLATMAVVLVMATGLAWAASGDTVADRVLGQTDFTSKLCNKGANQPTSGRLCVPSDAAVAPSGRLFVSDTGNNRVLSWPSAASFTNGELADLVIGQADFKSRECNKGTNQPGPAKLCQPYGVEVDSAGRLYVADQNNSRVLQFTPPFTTNMQATKVFGQADFTSGQCNKGSNQVGATKLCGPYNVGTDGSGNLYVADTSNNRVLQYTPPLASNMQASKVFGQTDFTSREANRGRASPSSHTLFRPFGVAVDGGGNLYVADFKNHRALEYDTPLTSGMAAARVFGQGGSFATNIENKGGVSANSLYYPTDVAVDGSGNFYAVDQGNNRILEYNTPLTTNTTADQVFGQGGSFATKTCNNGGVGANSLCGPNGVGTDSAENLYAGDYANHRVLGYDAPIP